jgi:hypothetical protein
MNLCGFQVGLDRPLFLIGGSAGAWSRGPGFTGDATVEALAGTAAVVYG